MKNSNIGTRILLGFAIVTLIAATAGGLATSSLLAMTGALGSTAQTILPTGLFSGSLLLLIASEAAAAVGICGIAFWAARGITRPLNTAVSTLNGVAAGDLTLRAKAQSRDQLGALTRATNLLIDNLQSAVGIAGKIAEGDLSIQTKTSSEKDLLGNALQSMIDHLRHTTREVNDVAGNIALVSQHMTVSIRQFTRHASEHAAAAEQGTSCADELAASLQVNAENARQTDRIASRTCQEAQTVSDTVAKASIAMNDVRGNISVFEEIGRKADLLALNAAVEAARAGDQGRGFAVFATEVRKLAERSQTAAADISRLVAGAAQAGEQANDLLARLLPAIQKTSELVQQVAAAAAQQSTGAGRMQDITAQLVQMIHQHSTSIGEIATTADELSNQSALLESVGRYLRLDPSQSSGSQNISKSIGHSERLKSNRLTLNPVSHADSLKRMQNALRSQGPVIQVTTHGTAAIQDEEFIAY